MADAREAVEFLRLCDDAESTMRSEGMEDLRFRYGEQWTAQIEQSRMLEARPALTINETDAFIRKIENSQRQQRPRINPHPVGSKASIQVAKVLKGLCRHVEVNSDADNAYDLAFCFAVTMGWGYFRMRTDYVREDSFDQDIFIDQVENPFSVYFDPNSTLPDGSDQERSLITDLIPRETFRKQYPGAKEQQFTSNAAGDAQADWVKKESIRVAEYFTVERKKAKLVKLSDGSVMYSDILPNAAILDASGIRVVGSRDSYRRIVTWQKQTETEILEERVLPGRWIPVIPVYGVRMYIDNKRRTFGLVRFAKDPQTMLNFWQTSMTEITALAPKAKWLLADGQDEGHENEFARANVSALPYLRYKPTTVDGVAVPPPQRVQPEAVPQASMVNAQMMAENLKRVLGVFDPQTKTDGNRSGKAIFAEKQQSEESNFNYYDNLTRSLKHAGRIILDWTPRVYDTERVMRIIGEDGKPSLVTLNQPKVEDGVSKILNDVRVAEYDVVMDTGPGYNTKRQEAVAVFTQMLSTPLGEPVVAVAADLIIRQLDVPGAQEIADRMAAANPLSQIDELSEVPPKVQMMVKALQQKVEQQGQQLQAAGQEIKSRMSVQELKEAGANFRAELTSAGEKDERRITERQKVHDSEVFAQVSQNVAEIKGWVELLKEKMKQGHDIDSAFRDFDMEMKKLDKQQAAKHAETEPTGA